MEKKNMTNKIGVVAICYNESRDIVGFVENIRNWVDEIVIIDDGSTDSTQSLIDGLIEPKLKFIKSPRQAGEFFADQRNKGIDISNCEWLLHMDIDERVTSSLRNEIIAAISQYELDAFRFKRKNYFLNRPMRGGGWADWNQIHLAKKTHLRFSGMYHEKVELMDNTKIGQFNSFMIHLNDDNYSERIVKSQRYLIEITNELRSSNKRITLLLIFHIGITEILKKYIIKRGYLDGKLGLFWALHAAMARMKAAMILWDEQHRFERDNIQIP
jgi:glycosyltransferase involved in cell wall biosynthesis